MNFRHKYAVLTVRVLLGLLLLLSGVSGFMTGFGGFNGVPADMLDVTKMLWSAGIFELAKTTEIVVGAMLLIGFLPALAALLLAPLSVGILVFHAFAAPQYAVPAIIVALLNAYLGYAYWDKYKGLFSR